VVLKFIHVDRWTDRGISSTIYLFNVKIMYISRIHLIISKVNRCLVNLTFRPHLIYKVMFLLLGMIWLRQWNSLSGVARNIVPHPGRTNWHAK
jgi:hypothetical protein